MRIVQAAVLNNSTAWNIAATEARTILINTATRTALFAPLTALLTITTALPIIALLTTRTAAALDVTSAEGAGTTIAVHRTIAHLTSTGVAGAEAVSTALLTTKVVTVGVPVGAVVETVGLAVVIVAFGVHVGVVVVIKVGVPVGIVVPHTSRSNIRTIASAAEAEATTAAIEIHLSTTIRAGAAVEAFAHMITATID
jgi:hypothetical protein